VDFWLCCRRILRFDFYDYDGGWSNLVRSITSGLIVLTVFLGSSAEAHTGRQAMTTIKERVFGPNQKSDREDISSPPLFDRSRLRSKGAALPLLFSHQNDVKAARNYDIS
jgi:hypothetical protein